MAAGVNSGLRKPAWIGVTSRPQQPPAPTTTTTTTLPSSLHHLASRPLLLYRRATSAFRYFSTLILTLDSLPEPPPRWKQPWSCSSLASPPFQVPDSLTDGNLQCGQQRKQQKRRLHVRGFSFSIPTGLPQLT